MDKIIRVKETGHIWLYGIAVMLKEKNGGRRSLARALQALRLLTLYSMEGVLEELVEEDRKWHEGLDNQDKE